MATLVFKIQHYRDVVIDYDSVNALPERSTNVSSRIKFVKNMRSMKLIMKGFLLNVFPLILLLFFAHLPNEQREVEEIREFLDNAYSLPIQEMDWSNIGISPINEYNIKGLLDTKFHTLFPTRDVGWLQ